MQWRWRRLSRGCSRCLCEGHRHRRLLPTSRRATPQIARREGFVRRVRRRLFRVGLNRQVRLVQQTFAALNELESRTDGHTDWLRCRLPRRTRSKRQAIQLLGKMVDAVMSNGHRRRRRLPKLHLLSMPSLTTQRVPTEASLYLCCSPRHDLVCQLFFDSSLVLPRETRRCARLDALEIARATGDHEGWIGRHDNVRHHRPLRRGPRFRFQTASRASNLSHPGARPA